MQEIPIGAPNYAKRPAIVRRSAHGRADERALIETEIMERQGRQRRQEELRQQREQQAQVHQQPSIPI